MCPFIDPGIKKQTTVVYSLCCATGSITYSNRMADCICRCRLVATCAVPPLATCNEGLIYSNAVGWHHRFVNQ